MCRTGTVRVAVSVVCEFSCYSVGRYSNDVSDYRNILSLTTPHSSNSKIHTRISFETAVFIKVQGVTYIRVQYSY